MFRQALRAHAKVGVALASAPALLSSSLSENHVYSSGEALGRGVRLEYWKAKHENVVVLDLESELIQLGMSRIRDFQNEGAQFVHDAHSILRATVDLAITELPNDEEAVVTTPHGHKVAGVMFEDDVKVCGVSVASRADVAKGLTEVLRLCLPYDSKLGEIAIQDLGNRCDVKISKATLPDGIDDHEVLVLCPEMNSLDKVSKVIHLLRQHGVEEEKISVVTLVTCPEAADKFCQTFGDAKLVTASYDASRDKAGFIVPGIGDFEERYCGAPAPDLPTESAEASDAGSDSSSKSGGWWPFGSK